MCGWDHAGAGVQVQCVHRLEHVQVLGHGGSFGYGWTVLLEGKKPRASEGEKRGWPEGSGAHQDHRRE